MSDMNKLNPIFSVDVTDSEACFNIMGGWETLASETAWCDIPAWKEVMLCEDNFTDTLTFLKVSQQTFNTFLDDPETLNIIKNRLMTDLNSLELNDEEVLAHAKVSFGMTSALYTTLITYIETGELDVGEYHQIMVTQTFGEFGTQEDIDNLKHVCKVIAMAMYYSLSDVQVYRTKILESIEVANGQL